MNSEKSLSVLVLAYNEEHSVVRCLEEVLYACEPLSEPYEIIVVNDGSTDRTLELATEFANQHPNVRVVSNQVNTGYGGAYKRGLAEAKMNYLGVVGAVNAINKDSLREIFSKVGQKDMILTYIANPEARPMKRRIISFFYVRIVRLLFGYRLKYYAGCNIFPTAKIREMRFSDSHIFLVQILFRLLDEGLSYHMMPMVLKPRLIEHSNALRLKNILSVIANLVKMFYSRQTRRLLHKNSIEIDKIQKISDQV